MTREEITKAVKKIIEEVTDISMEEMENQTSIMDDLGISSMEVITIFADIEKRLHVYVPDAIIRRVVTIDDIINYIEKQNLS